MALLLWCYDDICAHPPAGVRPKGFLDFFLNILDGIPTLPHIPPPPTPPPPIPHAAKQAWALSGRGPGLGPLGVYGGWGRDFVIYGAVRGNKYDDQS